jgi:prevent-host-death family protein
VDEIGLFDAKNKFSALVDRAERGEEVIITRRGRPVAKLVPVKAGHDVEKAHAAMRRIRERAKKFGGSFDWEEWKRYRDEGRR